MQQLAMACSSLRRHLRITTARGLPVAQLVPLAADLRLLAERAERMLTPDSPDSLPQTPHILAAATNRLSYDI